jgi:Fasciclin domain
MVFQRGSPMKLHLALAAMALSTATAAQSANIVEIAAGDERFSTLVAAVTAAGLAETLAGPGPFTVFAPVNDAFAALPAGTVDTLLKPENKADRRRNPGRVELLQAAADHPTSVHHQRCQRRDHRGRNGCHGDRGCGGHHRRQWRDPCD